MPTVMKDDVEIDLLRSLLSYDQDTGLLHWKIGSLTRSIGQVAGAATNRGYVKVCISNSFYLAHRIAFAIHYGRWPSGEVDHINQVKSDNRILNLRECTKSENCRNRALTKANKSGFRGVFWDPRRKNWRAGITFDGKRTMLGRFPTPELAYEVFLAKEAEMLKAREELKATTNATTACR